MTTQKRNAVRKQMNDHAERVYAARTAALRAPEKKLYRVSVESIMAVEDTLVEATSLREAIEKLAAARLSMRHLDQKSYREYTNERNLPEAQMKARERKSGLSHTWTVWAVEAEVIR